MKLSIVLPVIKLDYFKEALQSTIDAAQDLDFEIIIIDVTIVGIPRFSNFTPEHIGLISAPGSSYEKALHLGLQQAKGEYIALMNDDDLCAPNRFSTQLGLLEDSAADVAVGRLRKIGKISIDLNFSPNLSKFSSEMLLLGAYGANAALMFRKGWLLEHFEVNEYLVWDWQFALEKFKYARIVGSNQAIYFYRQHPKQVTRTTQHAQDVLESIPSNWLNYCAPSPYTSVEVAVVEGIILPRQRKLRRPHKIVSKSNFIQSRIELFRWFFWYYERYNVQGYSFYNKVWFYYHAAIRFMLI